MHFSLVRLSTPRMPETRGFDDVLLPLRYAFGRLGYQAEIRLGSFNPHSRNICLGANYDPERQWHQPPPGSIVLNLEQLEAEGYPWLKDGRYLRLLAAFEVWDFSRRNIDFLAAKGLSAAFLPLGYVPEMSRLGPCPAPLSDVLFYGGLNPRRRRVLDELRARGLKVNLLTKAYGPARDQALYAARLFLNIHHSLPASLEMVRLGYVLANARPVLSELAPDTYHYPEIKDAAEFRPYEELVPAALELLADRDRLDGLARRGLDHFSKLRLEDALEKLVGRRPAFSSGADFVPLRPRPNRLLIEAGPDFDNESLNVGGDGRMRPDLRLDLGRPLDSRARRRTERFGEIELTPGSFESLTVPRLGAWPDDLDQLMANCLELLSPGGLVSLTGPYDLSGAAAGGRAFNEQSWRRYTEESYLQGWTAASFELVEIKYRLSDYGRVLEARGRDLDFLRRTPRAISSIRAVLRKRLLSPEELTGARFLTREIYQGPVEAWQAAAPEEQGFSEEKLPPAWGLRLRLVSLGFRRRRYLFHLKYPKLNRHGRYQEKLAAAEKALEETRRLLKMYD
ncbi:MAG: hypothetical protein LBP33_12220 [Candidatus Adiutrix sp.]|jgi:hypothetical protein|nr:hypothetical protein [Candidatus Adiutrix sp.]